MEAWLDVPDYEGLYQVSDLGNFKSVERRVPGMWGTQSVGERILKQAKKKTGYLYVTLCKGNKAECFRAHKLVAMVFCSNPENKTTINHKNGIKDDNRAVNLEFNTPQENTIHARRVLGRQIGELIWNAKLVLDQQTGIFYSTLREAVKARPHLDYKQVSSWLSGKRTNKSSLIYV